MVINKYKNRYGDEYWYQPVSGGFTVEGDLALSYKWEWKLTERQLNALPQSICLMAIR